MTEESALSCPSCRQAMQSCVLPRRPEGTVTLDICYSCQGIWFDEFESLQLAPAGVIALFRQLHAHHQDQRLPWNTPVFCPRCDERMVPSFDISKNGRFTYQRCLQQHGRFNSFGSFFQEKGFVRQLSGAEIAKLAEQVQTIRCSGCGAPVDIRSEQICGHCHAPIVVLDPEAVQKALASYEAAARPQPRRDALAVGDALIANARARQYATRPISTASDGLDAADLIFDGVSTLLSLLSD